MNAVLDIQPDAQMWTDICAVDDIVPNTGVCALIDGRHVAVFRVRIAQGDQFFAIDNLDPKTGASVIARGLVGNLGEHIVVASPLYKHHFDLRTGACLEAAELSLQAHDACADQGRVLVRLN